MKQPNQYGLDRERKREIESDATNSVIVAT